MESAVGDSAALRAPSCYLTRGSQVNPKLRGCSQQQRCQLMFLGDKEDVGESYTAGKILVSHFFPLPKAPHRPTLAGAGPITLTALNVTTTKALVWCNNGSLSSSTVK